MAIELHCSPPSNIVTHGIEVTGRAKTVVDALVEAATKLNVEVPRAEKALRADAKAAECPGKCRKKTISNFFILKGVTFRIHYDKTEANPWNCTIGLGSELDVLCEPEREGDRPLVQG